MKQTNVKIEGYEGHWNLIDNTVNILGVCLLWENEEMGDEFPCIITDTDMKVLFDEAWNGFGDLQEKIENDEIYL